MIQLITDLDRLVGTRPAFLPGRWIEAARRWGVTDTERRLYEWNARNLITMWGTRCTEGEYEDLNLYAHKQWQGMFADYYRPRWEEFFRRLNRSVARGAPFDRARFVADMEAWERTWSGRTERFPTEARGDELMVARQLYEAYVRARSGVELRRSA